MRFHHARFCANIKGTVCIRALIFSIPVYFTPSRYSTWTTSKPKSSWDPHRELYPSLTPFSHLQIPEVYADVKYYFSEFKTSLEFFWALSCLFVFFFCNNQTSDDSSFFNNTLQLVRLLILCTLLSRALLTLDLLPFFLSTTYTARLPRGEHITKQRNSKRHIHRKISQIANIYWKQKSDDSTWITPLPHKHIL